MVTYIFPAQCDDRLNELMKLLGADGGYIAGSPLTAVGKIIYIYAPNYKLTDLSGIAEGSTVYCGFADAALKESADEKSIKIRCFNEDRMFTVKNALLTAEACVGELLIKERRAIGDIKILVCGFGRVGRAVVKYLAALGADTDVATTSPANVLGYAKPVSYDGLDAGKYDVVINTVPVKVLGNEFLNAFKGYIFELASPPYGFDKERADRAGTEYYILAALPAKRKPQAAAKVMAEFIREDER